MKFDFLVSNFHTSFFQGTGRPLLACSGSAPPSFLPQPLLPLLSLFHPRELKDKAKARDRMRACDYCIRLFLAVTICYLCVIPCGYKSLPSRGNALAMKTGVYPGEALN
jgi:hypothetical protein